MKHVHENPSSENDIFQPTHMRICSYIRVPLSQAKLLMVCTHRQLPPVNGKTLPSFEVKNIDFPFAQTNLLFTKGQTQNILLVFIRFSFKQVVFSFF